MTLSEYIEPRQFRSPYLKLTESVSGACALWALLLGPGYYWRKRAPVEAIVLGALSFGLFILPDQVLGIGISHIDFLSPVVWIVFSLGAPALLANCYLRKGWVEVSSAGKQLSPIRAISELDDDDLEAELRSQHGRNAREDLSRKPEWR